MKDMAANKIKTEAEWMAEEDARTMAHYEEIIQDSKRKAAAIKAAKSMASDLNQRANVMNKVASTKSPSKSSSSRSKKK